MVKIANETSSEKWLWLDVKERHDKEEGNMYTHICTAPFIHLGGGPASCDCGASLRLAKSGMVEHTWLMRVAANSLLFFKTCHFDSNISSRRGNAKSFFTSQWLRPHAKPLKKGS